ncbi:hypothetical protein M0805_006242, partial [Coniferiporia weirii]
VVLSGYQVPEIPLHGPANAPTPPEASSVQDTFAGVPPEDRRSFPNLILGDKRTAAFNHSKKFNPEIGLKFFTDESLSQPRDVFEIDDTITGSKANETIARGGRKRFLTDSVRGKDTSNSEPFKHVSNLVNSIINTGTAIENVHGHERALSLPMAPVSITEPEGVSMPTLDGRVEVKEAEDSIPFGKKSRYDFASALEVETDGIDSSKRDNKAPKRMLGFKESSEAWPPHDGTANQIRHRRRYRIIIGEVVKLIRKTLDLSSVFVRPEDFTEERSLNWVHRDVDCGDRLVSGDLEYSRSLNPRIKHEIRTGTLDFMAVEVTNRGYAFHRPKKEDLTFDKVIRKRALKKGQSMNQAHVEVPSPPHFRFNRFHDMEALWWISVWVLFFCDDKSQPGTDDSRRAGRKWQAQELFPKTLNTSTRHFCLVGEDNFLDATSCLSPSFEIIIDALEGIKSNLIIAYEEAEINLLEIKTDGYDELVSVYRTGFGICIESADLLVPAYEALLKGQAIDNSAFEFEPKAKCISGNGSVQVVTPSRASEIEERLATYALRGISRKQYHHKIRYQLMSGEITVPIHSSVFAALKDCRKILEYLHGSGWIHHDISCGNTSLYGGRELLRDFGYAKYTGSDTKHEVRTGTLDFMAVEVTGRYYNFQAARDADEVFNEAARELAGQDSGRVDLGSCPKDASSRTLSKGFKYFGPPSLPSKRDGIHENDKLPFSNFQENNCGFKRREDFSSKGIRNI